MRLRGTSLSSRYRLLVALAIFFQAVYAVAGELHGTEWRVTRGDTLYEIGRTIYPHSPEKQSRLRQDIMILNPEVFAKSADIQAGVVLRLPEYVVNQQAGAPPKKQRPAAAVPAAKPTADAARPATTTGRQWIVKRGDTLYGISRSVYPGDVRKQKRLRQGIMRLNPAIFARGVNNLAAGVVLRLPDSEQQAQVAQPRPTEAIADTVKPSPEPTAAPERVTTPPLTPEPESVSPPPPEPATAAAVTEPESVATSSEPTRAYRIESGFLASLGFGYGGDELVRVSNGVDISGGSGINLRLGYQQLRDDGHGYRLALGYQYHSAEDTSLTDTYLQAAYQYKADPFVYGFGLVAHSGAELEDTDTDVEFDPAIGLLVYAEHAGEGYLGGWGLSYTAIDFDDKDSGDSVDASHVEVYYSWHF